MTNHEFSTVAARTIHGGILWIDQAIFEKDAVELVGARLCAPTHELCLDAEQAVQLAYELLSTVANIVDDLSVPLAGVFVDAKIAAALLGAHVQPQDR